MIISYQGLESFKISQGDLALLVNPKPSSRTKADITLYSTGPAEKDDSFAISGPGEYEVKDIAIKGFQSEAAGSKINTIYLISFEGMNLAFLGALANAELSKETKESLEDIDILFVPIGGEGVLDAAAAYKLAVSLEPSVIIPMHYTDAALKQFLKEGGEDKVEPLDKLVMKKKDLEGKEGDIIVLKEE
jgi:hypothetical protein